MCVVIPVTHLACTHTEIVWQYCIETTKTEVHGIEPCSHEREHARPIMTRKLCYTCGGQRYFARRGGIAERGSGSEVSFLEMLGQKDFSVKMLGKREDYADQTDSGYHSEITLEEMDGVDSEEDEEFPLSPKTSPTTSTRLRRARKHSNLNRGFQTPRSAPSSEGCWSPKLKTELEKEQVASPPTTNPIPRAIQSVPRLKDPRPRPRPRKGSTLLHPSPPTDLVSTSTATPPAHYRPSYPRKDSTLLHPSSPSKTLLPNRSPTPTPRPVYRTATPFPFLPAPVFSPPLSSSIRQQLSSHSLFADAHTENKHTDVDVDVNLDPGLESSMPFSLDFGPPTILHSSYSDAENENEDSGDEDQMRTNKRMAVYTPCRSYFDWDDSDEEDDEERDEGEDNVDAGHGHGNGNTSRGLTAILARTAKVARASRISYPYHGRAPQGVVPR
ncbi:hypothetical protein P154DRAFT_561517 [Amniculicola lignicola CBS 123094]|uniref:Uncharacterized protein n=1 Tax=Amniculicola lignicola CBS 123094 TaxID=1392246 RepID=A0A6A5WQ37_9PLEO|nr:hypothetical protein P154DRAFT_561517 [Amniculicola lignicola CBS 123094]